jgi:hypothetical protein
MAIGEKSDVADFATKLPSVVNVRGEKAEWCAIPLRTSPRPAFGSEARLD